MTRAEAGQLRERARLMAEVELSELRSTPPETKLIQAGRLLEAARAMNWRTGDLAGDEAVRARWRRLREIHHVRG